MKIILSFLFLAFTALPTFAAEKETAYERVMRTQTFRCGYGVWEPHFMKDPNTGKLSGLYHDYMLELGKALSLKIEFTEETDWTAFGHALESGRIDGFCFDIWPTGARAREMDFTRPIFYTVINAYVRADDNRFDKKLDAINSDKVTISTLDGEMSNTIAANDYPAAKVLSAPQIAGQVAMMDNVATGKADITFTDPSSANNYMAAHPGKMKMVVGSEAVRIFGSTTAIKKNEYPLKALLDAGTSELLQSGVVERILKKYEKHPDDFKRVAKPYEVK